MVKQFVLVLGDFPQALAVVRSLGRAGYGVVVGSEITHPISAESRYCDELWIYPDGLTDSFPAQLADFVKSRNDLICVFPTGIVLAQHAWRAREEHALTLPIVSPGPQMLSNCVSKDRANRLADQASIKTPPSNQVCGHAELLDSAKEIGFPCIIKTVDGEAQVLNRKAFIVRNEAELRQHFTAWPQQHSRLMVQAYIEGRMLACDFVAHNGDVIAYYQGSHHRTDMPDGTGFVVEFRAAEPTPDLFNLLKRFVARYGYSGPGLLQCIMEKQTGEYYFVELNPRLSAGVAEAVNAGLDLPTICMSAALNQPPPALQSDQDTTYDIRSTTYWFERDFLGWLNQRPELTARESRVWLTNMIRCWLTSNGHINWQWRDPLPSLRILGRFLKGLAHPTRSAPRNG